MHYSDYRAKAGDTVLNTYQRNMYPNILSWPASRQRELLDLWEEENLGKDPNKILAGATYTYAPSKYGEDRRVERDTETIQTDLRKTIGGRLTMDDYFKVSGALAGLDSAGAKQVNAPRIAMGDRGTFRMPSGGLTAANVSKMMNIGEEEILNKIINMQSQANLKSLKEHREWYTKHKFDPHFFEAARTAFEGAQTARRGEGTERRAEDLHPGAKIIQGQTIGKGNERTIKIGDDFVNQKRDDENSPWVTVSTAPRWQDTDAAPAHRTINRDGQEVVQNWDKDKKVWVDAETAPRWQYKPPETKQASDGRLYYSTGPNKGGLVFPDVTVDPPTETDVNGRRRYSSGLKKGELVFQEDGKPIPKEYAPKDPGTAKDANGRLRFTTGDNKGKLVFDAVKVDPKLVADTNGRWRYATGDKEGQLVFGEDTGGIAKEYKPEGLTTKQRDFEYWLDLRKAGGIDDSGETIHVLWEKFMATQQRVDKGFGPKEISEFISTQRSFLNSNALIGRMLRQLGNKKVLTGAVGAVFSGWENITDQFTQLAHTMGDTHLFNPDIYRWGRGDLKAAFGSDIIQLAYTLARSADPNAKLSDFDIQVQIDRITAGSQSKSSMAAALVNIHNINVNNMGNTYRVFKKAELPGTELAWEDYLSESDAGYLVQGRHSSGQEFIGYYVWVTNEKGEQEEKIRPIAVWQGGQ